MQGEGDVHRGFAQQWLLQGAHGYLYGTFSDGWWPCHRFVWPRAPRVFFLRVSALKTINVIFCRKFSIMSRLSVAEQLMIFLDEMNEDDIYDGSRVV